MKTTRHTETLTQLTQYRMVNMYFVDEEDGLTLIDNGMSGSSSGIITAAEQLARPIRRITLTHAHMDHAASLDALRQALPDAELVLPERAALFLTGDTSLLPGEPQVPLRGNYVTAASMPDRTVAPGGRIGSLRVVAAPGHTPDQVAFYDERDGTLIAGDAFQTLGGFAVSGVMRWRFPLPARATWDLPTAVRTAHALADLQPTCLAVGHGAVLKNPGEAIARGIVEAQGKIHAQAQTT